jgi:hypothetical protein
MAIFPAQVANFLDDKTSAQIDRATGQRFSSPSKMNKTDKQSTLHYFQSARSQLCMLSSEPKHQ